jgi:hypothetical protein
MRALDRTANLPYDHRVDLTLTIPDDLAARLGVADLPRQALEALAAEAYQAGRLTQPELRRLLGLRTNARLDGFLKAHGINASGTAAELEHSDEESKQADAVVARFRAFRAGKTLGGLDPAVLIREGRR